MDIKIATAAGDQKDICLQPRSMNFKDFATMCATPRLGDKGTQGYFISGDIEFAEEYITQNGIGRTYRHIYPRNGDYLKSMSVLVLDVDNGEDIYDIHKALKILCYIHFGYTTSTKIIDGKLKQNSRFVIPCNIQNKKVLTNSIEALHQELRLKGVDPRPAAVEETTWCIPWFFATIHDEPKFVEYHNGKNFTPRLSQIHVIDSVELKKSLPLAGNRQTYDELLEIICKGDKDSGVHAAILKITHMSSLDNVPPYWVKSVLVNGLKGTPHEDYINDIDRQINRAYGKLENSKNPRSLKESCTSTELNPFPLEVLDNRLVDAFESIHKHVGLDPATLAMMYIPFISGIIARQVAVRGITDTHIFMPTVFVLMQGDSGKGKSHILDNVFQERIFKKLNDNILANRLGWLRNNEKAYVRFKADIVKKAPPVKDGGRKDTTKIKDILYESAQDIERMNKIQFIKEYEYKQGDSGSLYIGSNFTSSGLGKVLYLKGGCGIIAFSEMSTFNSNVVSGALSATKKPDLDIILQAFVGGKIEEPVRSSKESARYPEYRGGISGLLMGQDTAFDEHYNGPNSAMLQDRGMYSREIPIEWPSFIRQTTEENARIDKDAISVLSSIANGTGKPYYKDVNPLPSPYAVPWMDQEGTFNKLVLVQPKVMIDFFKDDINSSELVQLSNKFNRNLETKYSKSESDLINKYFTMSLSITAIIYCMENADSLYDKELHEMPKKYINIVKIVLSWLIKNAIQVTLLREATATYHKASKILRTLLAPTARGDLLAGVTPGKLDNKLKAHGGNSYIPEEREDYEKALNLLVDYNHLIEIKVLEDVKTMTYFILNPHYKEGQTYEANKKA